MTMPGRKCRMVILQGLPGSGKSYLVETLQAIHYPSNLQVASADHHVDYDEPVGPQLPEAHSACWRSALFACISRTPLVMIDNTNLSVAEVAPYYQMGEALGYEVEIQRLSCPGEIAFERQTHGVPREAFDLMVGRLQAFVPMPWWHYSVI